MGKILEDLASELGIEARKTDDEEDEGIEPKTKKAVRNTHQAEAEAREEKTTHRPRRTRARTANQEQQTSPTGKEKERGRAGTPTSSEFQVASITVSGNE